MSDDSPLSLHRFLPIEFRAARHEAAEGAEEKVLALFGDFRARILRYLFCLGLSTQDGEEVVQEVFLSLFRQVRENRMPENPGGWLFRVAHNLGLKKRMETQRTDCEDHERYLSAADSAPSPEMQAMIKQKQRQLAAVVEALPVQDRSCLYLRAEGMRYREISEVLGVSIGTVSQCLTRAVRKLNHVFER